MTEYNGPEMTTKQLVVLLSTAALIVALFVLRTLNSRESVVPQPERGPRHIHISQFDSLMQECQDSTFDWLLLSAIAYVESKFDTVSSSGKGAQGLMQMMPSTCHAMLREMDMDTDFVSTELQVRAAVRYLHSLDSSFIFINKVERLNFILGAYNGGSNHIFDAMRLARRDEINRFNWSCLTPVLKSLSIDSVAADSLCHYGKFDAAETLSYVALVQKKYSQYRRMELAFLDSLHHADSLRDDSLYR